MYRRTWQRWLRSPAGLSQAHSACVLLVTTGVNTHVLPDWKVLLKGMSLVPCTCMRFGAASRHADTLHMPVRPGAQSSASQWRSKEHNPAAVVSVLARHVEFDKQSR